jgi:uncharacterized protein (DUF58 family)
LDTAELLKKVRKIEIKTRGLSQHLFTGSYHSAFKGRGMSFSEVRNYQFGDDVRNIDWNVTARTGSPYVKIFEEERELTVMLLVDVSGSSFFGTTPANKQQILTEMCAVLAFSAIENNDKVGLLLFSDKIECFLPPQKGREHILRIIRELLEVQPSEKGTDYDGAIQFIRNVLHQRSVCFLLSDFIGFQHEMPLKILSRRHDCIGIHCWDQRERTLPDVGLLSVRPLEGRGQSVWIDTGDPDVRRAYRNQFDTHLERTKTSFRRAGADYLRIETGHPYIQSLMGFFQNRRRTLV